ncbi:hypothetical protein [Paenibacillus ehimensis]|uniref:Uncharacterized protein n=1 Tax=Paenibacillus ehimensis TaxID=79264 RepID=A0ABT8VCI0_9BACL|nr:hypothetical protein [Paenibacillus ehimensis]MDO3678696.1 hypothetical protein [Paenibacillus ehimensis]
MAYEAKTNWQLDDTVTEGDMNRIEKGVMDAYTELQGLRNTMAQEIVGLNKAVEGIRSDQTKELVVEVRTSDPNSPAIGSMWIRSDL